MAIMKTISPDTNPSHRCNQSLMVRNIDLPRFLRAFVFDDVEMVWLLMLLLVN